MAGRSSIGVGVGVTIFILATSTVALLVVWAVFFTKYKQSQTELQTARTDINDFVGAGERNQDSIRSLVEQAKKAGGKSVVSFLNDSMQNTMQHVTGSKLDTAATLEERLKSIPAASGGRALLAVIADRDNEIASLKGQVATAQALAETARKNMQAEVDRVKSIETAHTATVTALNVEVGQYKSEVDTFRQGIDKLKSDMDAKIKQVESEGAAASKRLNDQIQKLTEENLILKNQLLALRKDRNTELLRGKDEYALVDATILGVNGSEHQCFISIGENKKAVLGMSFVVYPSAAAIRPDAEGNYPRGKATIEITSVGPTSSTCRIVTETRGNPIVAGDVVANAIYDPNKVYKFVTFGNFDINRDGIATPGERTDLQALIEAWGGKVVDDLSGDVDFLILGERPILPPQPPPDAANEFFQQFIQQQRIVARYDELYRKGSETSVPILNENRLYTLIGKTPAAAR